MYEQARKINERLKSMFKGIEIRQKEEISEEAIANIFIRFGQIAKFRCRNNTAYKNFLDTCFDGLFKIVQVKDTTTDKEGNEKSYIRFVAVKEDTK